MAKKTIKLLAASTIIDLLKDLGLSPDTVLCVGVPDTLPQTVDLYAMAPDGVKHKLWTFRQKELS